MFQEASPKAIEWVITPPSYSPRQKFRAEDRRVTPAGSATLSQELADHKVRLKS